MSSPKHVAQMVWEGFFGHLDTALAEVTAIIATRDSEDAARRRFVAAKQDGNCRMVHY